MQVQSIAQFNFGEFFFCFSKQLICSKSNQFVMLKNMIFGLWNKVQSIFMLVQLIAHSLTVFLKTCKLHNFGTVTLFDAPFEALEI